MDCETQYCSYIHSPKLMCRFKEIPIKSLPSKIFGRNQQADFNISMKIKGLE